MKSADEVCLCRTEKGYLGWIRQSVEVGDKVCIFSGARAPFVLRERLDGLYTVECDAYILGIMDREAIQVSDLEWQEIGLKLKMDGWMDSYTHPGAHRSPGC